MYLDKPADVEAESSSKSDERLQGSDPEPQNKEVFDERAHLMKDLDTRIVVQVFYYTQNLEF